MDTAILSASAGLIGSLVGGVSTFAASWLTQRRMLRTQTIMQHAMQRQALYSDFIVEASKRLTEAWHPPSRSGTIGFFLSFVDKRSHPAERLAY
jgi:hypothetical protein